MSAKDSAQETKTVTQEGSSEPEEQSSSPEVEEAGNEPESSGSNPTPESEPPVAAAAAAAAPVTQWQAIWAPQYNAYYFYNSVTQETTWTNPLQPEASSSYTTTSTGQAAPGGSSNNDDGNEQNVDARSSMGLTTAAAHYSALQAAAIAEGIDPGLAHLDPTLLASVQGTSSVPGGVSLILHFYDHGAYLIRGSTRCTDLYRSIQRTHGKICRRFSSNTWSSLGVRTDETNERVLL